MSFQGPLLTLAMKAGIQWADVSIWHFVIYHFLLPYINFVQQFADRVRPRAV